MTKTVKIDQSVTSLEKNIERCLKQLGEKRAYKKQVSINLNDSLEQNRDYSTALDQAKAIQKRKKVLRVALIKDDKEIAELSEEVICTNEDIRIKKSVLSDLLDQYQKKTGKAEYHEQRIVKQLSLFTS